MIELLNFPFSKASKKRPGDEVVVIGVALKRDRRLFQLRVKH